MIIPVKSDNSSVLVYTYVNMGKLVYCIQLLQGTSHYEKFHAVSISGNGFTFTPHDMTTVTVHI